MPSLRISTLARENSSGVIAAKSRRRRTSSALQPTSRRSASGPCSAPRTGSPREVVALRGSCVARTRVGGATGARRNQALNARSNGSISSNLVTSVARSDH